MTRDILLNDILSDGASESSVDGGMVSRVSFMACRHSGRHVYVALGCVFDYATIGCPLRWGVALVGSEISTTELCSPRNRTPLSGTSQVQKADPHSGPHI